MTQLITFEIMLKFSPFIPYKLKKWLTIFKIKMALKNIDQKGLIDHRIKQYLIYSYQQK